MNIEQSHAMACIPNTLDIGESIPGIDNHLRSCISCQVPKGSGFNTVQPFLCDMEVNNL